MCILYPNKRLPKNEHEILDQKVGDDMRLLREKSAGIGQVVSPLREKATA